MTREDLTTFLDHVVDMMRFEAHVRQGVLKQLNRLHRQVKAYMASEDLTQLNQRQLNALIKEISVITGQTYDALLAQMQAHSQDLHQHEHAFMQAEFGDAWGVPPEAKPKSNFVPLVLGLTLAELLRKQQRDYIHLIKMSARNNEPIDHLSRWQSNKTKALTKTWVSSVSSQTRERLAKRAKKIKGWWHNSTLDGRTSNICLARHNKVWDKEGKPIGHDIPFRRDPLHPHCRSHVLPVTDVNQKPATMSVEDWLDGKTQAEQDKLLGKGKAQMYRRGDITLSDLLDQFGRPKPLSRLQAELGGSTVSPVIKMYRSTWRDDFPDTIIDRALGDATKHPLYEKAKAGDTKSAYLLAKDLVTDEAVEKIRKIKGDRDIVIVPVHAEEAIGKNKIPVAVTVILADRLGVSFNADIVQAIKVSRTDKDGWHRLANPPMFTGKLPKNSLGFLVDDTQTQGGTFAALKGHIENNGSSVIGAYALTGKQYSVQLRLSEKTLNKLRNEYSSIETWWQNEFGYGFDSLTEWEARYLIKSGKPPNEVRDTILARRLKTGG